MILDDNTDRLEVVLFDDVYNQCRHLITKDVALVVEGQLRFDEFSNAWQVTAQRIKLVDDKIEEYAKRITIQWPENSNTDFLIDLKETLQPFTNGHCEVCLEYAGPTARASLTLGDHWTVRPTRELRERLGLLLGSESYSIHYPKHFV